MSSRIPSYRKDDRTRPSRSRSPCRHPPPSHSHRERSPPRQHSDHKRKRSPDPTSTTAPKDLPFNGRQLGKRDYEAFKPMFALYMDIQKGKVLEEMDETEIKGRWKSFLGKWNRGELAEGWYDPSTLQKAVQSSADPDSRSRDEERARGTATRRGEEKAPAKEELLESESDEEIGPTLPGQEGRSRGGRMGPSIPRMEDLELKKEMEDEDGLARRDDIRSARKLDRKEQKEKLDELVPRAEAGTRERQLEKKKEINEKMKSFREKSLGAVEVPDAELMGGGDSIEGYKKVKQEFERKKNERELRKEEILRARMAEREERLQEYRAKEEGTMSMLKALAKQRFG